MPACVNQYSARDIDSMVSKVKEFRVIVDTETDVETLLCAFKSRFGGNLTPQLVLNQAMAYELLYDTPESTEIAARLRRVAKLMEVG